MSYGFDYLDRVILSVCPSCGRVPVGGVVGLRNVPQRAGVRVATAGALPRPQDFEGMAEGSRRAALAAG
jgi:hypothetical protein